MSTFMYPSIYIDMYGFADASCTSYSGGATNLISLKMPVLLDMHGKISGTTLGWAELKSWFCI